MTETTATTNECLYCGFVGKPSTMPGGYEYHTVTEIEYRGVRATRHSVPDGRDHIVFLGRCAGLGKWGIGPCQNAPKGTKKRPDWLEKGDGSSEAPLCGIHLNSKAFR